MKNILVYSLLSLFVLAHTELIQVVKLPLLVEHFLEHKSENKSVNIFSFLYIHYIKEVQTDNDYSEDIKLPFKSNQVSQNSSSSSLVPLQFILSSVYVFITCLKNTAIFSFNFISSSYHIAIWQPPRGL